MRSIPVEWGLFGIGPWNYSTNAQNVYNFWVVGAERAKPYEGIYTVGMRGDGDCESRIMREPCVVDDISNSTVIRDYEYRWFGKSYF